MMVTKSRELYRDRLRRSILDAAREEFAAHGYEGVSMRALAAKIGCTHGALYGHFANKEELFDRLVEESFERLADVLRGLRKPGRTTDPVRLLKKAGRAYVAFALENPAAYEFAFVMRRPAARPARPHLAYTYLRDLVQRCIDEKRFRRMSPDTASQAIWAAAHGVACLLIFRPSFPWRDLDALIARVIDSAVDGLVG
jgi:AcrR family transcriptional regulator